MLRVESSRACDGPTAKYEVWAQYGSEWEGGEPQLVRLALPTDNTSALERELGWPDDGNDGDPWTVLGVAGNVPENRDKMRVLGLPATTSLIRYCGQRVHRDGIMTAPRSGRLEVAQRRIWVPRGALGSIAVTPDGQADDRGMLRVKLNDTLLHGQARLVVSVPMTETEELAVQAHEIVPTVARLGGVALYALRHIPAEGMPVELLHRVAQSDPRHVQY